MLIQNVAMLQAKVRVSMMCTQFFPERVERWLQKIRLWNRQLSKIRCCLTLRSPQNRLVVAKWVLTSAQISWKPPHFPHLPSCSRRRWRPHRQRRPPLCCTGSFKNSAPKAGTNEDDNRGIRNFNQQKSWDLADSTDLLYVIWVIELISPAKIGTSPEKIETWTSKWWIQQHKLGFSQEKWDLYGDVIPIHRNGEIMR